MRTCEWEKLGNADDPCEEQVMAPDDEVELYLEDEEGDKTQSTRFLLCGHHATLVMIRVATMGGDVEDRR